MSRGFRGRNEILWETIASSPFLFPAPAVASPLACLSRVYFSRYPPNGELVHRLLAQFWIVPKLKGGEANAPPVAVPLWWLCDCPTKVIITSNLVPFTMYVLSIFIFVGSMIIIVCSLNILSDSDPKTWILLYRLFQDLHTIFIQLKVGGTPWAHLLVYCYAFI